MNAHEIQKNIFEQIEQKIKPLRLSTEVGRVLNLTSSAVYRRTSGETLLNLEEYILLKRHFGVDLAHLIDPSVVIFRLPSFINPPKNIYEYLSQTERNLENLTPFPQSILRFMAAEIPFYYFLSFPHLAAFKFYIWGRTLWQSNRGAYAKFNFDEYLKDAALQALIKRIVELNNQIQTEEIWSDSMLQITLNQIRYCDNSGLFEKPDDIKILLDDIKNLTAHLESVAQTGRKTMDTKSATIQIWDNELFQNPMHILTETPEQKLLYTNIDVPYFMISNDSNVYQVTYNYFDRIKSFSNDITLSNELNRRNYFERLYQKSALYEQEFKFKHVQVNGFAYVD